MQCIRPIKTSFDNEGNLTYSSKKAMNGLVPFQLPCRKCLPCRLNQAREKAIRCWHESKMHPDSIFLTLTYDDEHLRSPRLCYPEFQLFMKRLREKINYGITTKENRIEIPYLVTGEYGEKTKRPHWHALIYNYRPSDSRHYRTTERGEFVYKSPELSKLWGNGNLEFGDISIESANYTARYAAKKLVHGPDQSHDYHPIHKTSSKHAIGKKWIEKWHEQTFTYGYVTLPNGSKSAIPRYYKDWCKKHHLDLYLHWYADVLPKTVDIVEEQNEKDLLIYQKSLAENREVFLLSNGEFGFHYPKTQTNVKHTILKSKFKRLQERLKL